MRAWAILLGLLGALLAPVASAQIVSTPLQKIVTPAQIFPVFRDLFRKNPLGVTP